MLPHKPTDTARPAAAASGNATFRRLIALSLLGHLHWLFGNLYEAVVLGPNMYFVRDPVGQLFLWRQFFVLSNPIWYFLPWSPLTILVTLLAYWQSRRNKLPQRNQVALAALLSTSLGCLTAYIITHINLNIFVGNLTLPPEQIASLLTEVFWLAWLRVVLEIATVWSVYRMYRAIR